MQLIAAVKDKRPGHQWLKIALDSALVLDTTLRMSSQDIKRHLNAMTVANQIPR